MEDKHNQRDAAIDKTLAALRDAKPPEGMEERIARRLAQHPASSSASRRRNPLADPLLAGAWWRGAATGAAVAALGFGLLLFAGHRPRTAPQNKAQQHAIIPRSSTAAITPVSIAAGPSTAQPRNLPCGRPDVFRVRVTPDRGAPEAQSASALLVATNAPSRPAPRLGLTTQERELLQLAHTADAKTLDSLTPGAEARADAEEQAQFERFFAPPPEPPQPEPAAANNE